MLPKKRWGIYGYAFAIILLSTQLVWHLQLFFVLISAFFGWLFFRETISDRVEALVSDSEKKEKLWLLIIPFAVLLFTRSILFIKYNHYPALGYDMGIYKYEFERAESFFAAIKTSFYPGLIILVSLMQKIGLSVSFFMREFYILLNLLIGVMIYLTGREFFGKKVGFYSLILYTASLTQFTAYYFFLYKNVLALSLLLSTFILLHRRSYWAVLTGAYLGIVQPPDFLILAATMAIMFVHQFLDKTQRNYLLKTGGIIGGLFLLGFLARFNQIREGINLIFHYETHWDPSISGGGVFIDFHRYVEQAIYYLPFVLCGLIASSGFKKKKGFQLNFLHIGFLVSAVIVCFRLVFYKRYIIEFDIFALLFAAVGVYYFVEWYGKKWWQKTLWIVLGLALFVNISLESGHATPLLPSLEAARIKTLCKLPKNTLVMAVSNFYSPWLRGYSCHETIAPGLFEWNRWDEEGWKEFWNGDREKIEEKMETLKIYHKAIYIFVGSMQPQIDFSEVEGFTKIRSYLWRWDFKRELDE